MSDATAQGPHGMPSRGTMASACSVRRRLCDAGPPRRLLASENILRAYRKGLISSLYLDDTLSRALVSLLYPRELNVPRQHAYLCRGGYYELCQISCVERW
jgi:hypothetical protein